ncbi:MAG: helix-turn-helix transcriptional regulator [Verrucomicrobiota bacterium]
MARSPKVTQEDMVARLARQGLDLSQGMIAKLENGHRPINDFELNAIAKALRVPVQTFFEEALSANAKKVTK